MSEDKIIETGAEMIRKQIELAKVKRNKGNLSEQLKLENEIIDLRRWINNELDKIMKKETSSQ